jgi:hypothetical protein
MINKFFGDNNELTKKELHAIAALSTLPQELVDIEEIAAQFGHEVAKNFMALQGQPESTQYYEKSFDNYDHIFLKLIIRNSKYFVAIRNNDGDKFKSFIDMYVELRRKVMKSAKLHTEIMNYEAELIKFGRNSLAGKPIDKQKYQSLIL